MLAKHSECGKSVLSDGTTKSLIAGLVRVERQVLPGISVFSRSPVRVQGPSVNETAPAQGLLRGGSDLGPAMFTFAVQVIPLAGQRTTCDHRWNGYSGPVRPLSRTCREGLRILPPS